MNRGSCLPFNNLSHAVPPVHPRGVQRAAISDAATISSASVQGVLTRIPQQGAAESDGGISITRSQLLLQLTLSRRQLSISLQLSLVIQLLMAGNTLKLHIGVVCLFPLIKQNVGFSLKHFVHANCFDRPV